jgi:hypothetical protein
MENLEQFRSELTNLVKQFNVDTELETPDYMVSDHMMLCLLNLEATLKARKHWSVVE